MNWNPHENKALQRWLAYAMLAFAALCLVSGKAINAGKPKRTYVDRPSRVVTRAEDPVMFYFQVLTLLGLGGFLIYNSRKE